LIPGIDLLSVVGGVDITETGGEKKGGSSFTNSAIGTSKRSTVTGATFTGMSQFSEVRRQNYYTVDNTIYSHGQ
jgi:hypothetical protein